MCIRDSGKAGQDGKDGKIGINGKDGKSAEITVGKGKDGVDGKDGEAGQAGKDGITRIIYKDEKGKDRQVATLDDGLKFKGDNETVVTRKLNEKLDIKGGIADENLVTTGNIGVFGTQDGGMFVKLAKKLTGLTSAEFKDGDNITKITGGNISITKKVNNENKTVNLWDLSETVNTNAKATKVMVDGKESRTDGNLKIKKIEKDGQLTYDLSLNDEITIGKAGQDGKDGKIGINGKDGKSADITVGKGKDGVDGKNGENGITRIIYTDKDNKTYEVATLDDGLKFKGDNDTVVTRKLNEKLDIKGGIADENLVTTGNIGVFGTQDGGMLVKLAKKLTGLTSAEFKDGDNITNITGGNITITKKEGDKTTTLNLWDLSKNIGTGSGATLNFYSGGTIVNNAYNRGTTNWTMPLNEFRMDFGDGLKAEQVTDKDGKKYTLVTIDKDSLKNNDNFKGKAGKSAYEVWKEYKTDTGEQPNKDKSEKEFFESFKGAKGDKGDKGDPGAAGKPFVIVGDNGTGDGTGGTTPGGTTPGGTTPGGTTPGGTTPGGTTPGGTTPGGTTPGGTTPGGTTPGGTTPGGTTPGGTTPGGTTPGGTTPGGTTPGGTTPGGTTPGGTTPGGTTPGGTTPGGTTPGGTTPSDPNRVTLRIIGDKTNITTSVTNGNTVQISLNKDIKVNSVTVGATEGKDGKSGNPGVKIDGDGINMNGKGITNLAPGKIDTDAATVGQVKDVAKVVDTVTKTVGKYGKVLSEVQNESREGDAMGAAMAALKPLDFDPYNRSQIMAGISTYKGKQALSLGLARYSNEDTLLHAGVSYGGSSELMANAGISWRFGDKSDRDARAARNLRMPQYANGPISSIYVMQDEMESLRAENQRLKEKMAALQQEGQKMKDKEAQQDREIETMKQQIAMLLEVQRKA